MKSLPTLALALGVALLAGCAKPEQTNKPDALAPLREWLKPRPKPVPVPPVRQAPVPSPEQPAPPSEPQSEPAPAPVPPPVIVVPVPVPVPPTVQPKPQPAPKSKSKPAPEKPKAKPPADKQKKEPGCTPLPHKSCTDICWYARNFSESTLDSMRRFHGYCEPTSDQRSYGKGCIRRHCPEALTK